MSDPVVMLVSCGKRKSSVPCQAREMYNSLRFQKLKTIAETLSLDWYIMSAKYGLLAPSELIEPYDMCLAASSIEEQAAWAVKTLDKLKEFGRGTTFFVVADTIYSRSIVPLLLDAGFHVSAPFINRDEEIVASYMENASRIDDVAKMYGSLSYLAENTGGVRILSECNGRMYWPQRGVYFIVDYSEQSLILPGFPRIVRVGTHAVSRGSKSTLWNRIKTHKGPDSGFGNHRGSIFRLHVGNAIINQQSLKCDTWGKGQSANKMVRSEELMLEKLVSDYIGQLGVVVLDVDDEPSANSLRSFIEKNSIALVSSVNSSFNFPMSNWLGNYSQREEIRESALWNINYINSDYDSSFMNLFETIIDKTVEAYKK